VAAMRRSRSVLVVVVLGVTGVLVVPGGASAVAARSRCRAILFVAKYGSGTVSTIDESGKRRCGGVVHEGVGS
jgi:hypothetical protein